MASVTTLLDRKTVAYRQTEKFRNGRLSDPWTAEKAKGYYRSYNERWYQGHKEQHAATGARWVKEHYPQRWLIARRYVDGLRMKAMEVLGGAFCKTCGYESDFRALVVDHVNGGGQAEMRRINYNLPKMYRAIVEMGSKLAQAVYQVLCANCNRIKQFENKEFGRGRKFYEDQKKKESA